MVELEPAGTSHAIAFDGEIYWIFQFTASLQICIKLTKSQFLIRIMLVKHLIHLIQ